MTGRCHVNDNEYLEWEETQTREMVKSLPPHFKEFTLQQVRDYLQLLSPEDKVAWAHFIGKDPILRRVIYYVFSPAEETKGRFEMILTMSENNFVRDMEYVYFAIEQ